MTRTIFFSWQADTSTLVGRNLIERALEKALGRIEADTELEEAVRELEIDRDTKGVAGSPPIVDTIFKKIDAATVFLPDLTFVGQRLDGRPTPNPNVLIEYGWALKSLTHGRVVPVMNTAFGEPKAENMPFDMRHLRNPILYHCPANASEEDRRQAREGLAKALEGAIRAVISDADLEYSRKIVEPPQFVPRPSIGRKSRFREDGEAIGVLTRPIDPVEFLTLESGPSFWLRVFPKYDPGRSWSIDELQVAARRQPMMQPLSRNWPSLGSVRGSDGYGLYAQGVQNKTSGLGYIFRTGEIWSVDTHTLEDYLFRVHEGNIRVIYIREKDFTESLADYGTILKSLGIAGPMSWVAGMDGTNGWPIDVPRQRSGYSNVSRPYRGSCMESEVVVAGEYDPDHPNNFALRPFFERIYESCGVSRPQWLDDELEA